MHHEIAPEKTIFDVLRAVWRAKIFMAIGVCLGCITAYVVLGLAVPHYRAEMILAPASPMGQGAGYTAQMTEGSIQSQPDDLQKTAAFLRFETIYNGMSVASFLAEDARIINGLKDDVSFVFSDPQEAWTVAEIARYVRQNVILEPVSGTPLRRLSYLHPDGGFAMYLIARLHQIADEMIRADLLATVDKRMVYLNETLSTATNPEHRRSLAALLMEQERLKMLVSLDEPYAATVVEPPSHAHLPRWPDPFLLFAIFVFVGGFLGFVGYGLIYDRRS